MARQIIVEVPFQKQQVPEPQEGRNISEISLNPKHRLDDPEHGTHKSRILPFKHLLLPSLIFQDEPRRHPF